MPSAKEAESIAANNLLARLQLPVVISPNQSTTLCCWVPEIQVSPSDQLHMSRLLKLHATGVLHGKQSMPHSLQVDPTRHLKCQDHGESQLQIWRSLGFPLFTTCRSCFVLIYLQTLCSNCAVSSRKRNSTALTRWGFLSACCRSRHSDREIRISTPPFCRPQLKMRHQQRKATSLNARRRGT